MKNNTISNINFMNRLKYVLMISLMLSSSVIARVTIEPNNEEPYEILTVIKKGIQ